LKEDHVFLQRSLGTIPNPKGLLLSTRLNICEHIATENWLLVLLLGIFTLQMTP